MDRLSLHPLAAASEMGDLADTLAEDGLPHDDLSDPGRQFYAIRRADRWLGYIGMEGSGTDRLLRSFVIHADHRSGGLGSKALAMLENLARDGGHQAPSPADHHGSAILSPERLSGRQPGRRPGRYRQIEGIHHTLSGKRRLTGEDPVTGLVRW